MTTYAAAAVSAAQARAAASPLQGGQKVRAAGHVGRIVLIDGYAADLRYLVEFPATAAQYAREVWFTGKFLEAVA